MLWAWRGLQGRLSCICLMGFSIKSRDGRRVRHGGWIVTNVIVINCCLRIVVSSRIRNEGIHRSSGIVVVCGL